MSPKWVGCSSINERRPWQSSRLAKTRCPHPHPKQPPLEPLYIFIVLLLPNLTEHLDSRSHCLYMIHKVVCRQCLSLRRVFSLNDGRIGHTNMLRVCLRLVRRQFCHCVSSEHGVFLCDAYEQSGTA